MILNQPLSTAGHWPLEDHRERKQSIQRACSLCLQAPMMAMTHSFTTHRWPQIGARAQTSATNWTYPRQIRQKLLTYSIARVVMEICNPPFQWAMDCCPHLAILTRVPSLSMTTATIWPSPNSSKVNLRCHSDHRGDRSITKQSMPPSQSPCLNPAKMPLPALLYLSTTITTPQPAEPLSSSSHPSTARME